MKIVSPQIQKVVFRASRHKTPEISAVLIGQTFGYSTPLTVWDSQGGHGGATHDWYRSTRPAKPAEYTDELKKLQRQYAPKYKIEVRQKLS